MAVADRMREASTMKLVGIKRASLGYLVKNAEKMGLDIEGKPEKLMPPPAKRAPKGQQLIT